MSKSKKKKVVRRIFDKEKHIPGLATSRIRKQYKAYACPYTAELVNDTSTSGYDGNYEYIKYKIHSKKPYTTVLPCLHVKNVVNHFYLSHNLQENKTKKSCSGVQVPSSRWWYTFSGNYQQYSAGYRLPTHIPDLNLAHREALQFFASGCQPIEVNLAVNLFEIGEIFQMIKDLIAILLKLKNVYKTGNFPYGWKKFVRLLSTGGLRRDWKLSGVASDLYLQYSFAIAPLIADIKSATEMIKSLEDRIDWFINNNNKPVPVKFTKDLSSAAPLTTVAYPTPSATVQQGADTNARTCYKATYKAFALATYDVSGLSKRQIGYRLLKQASGFSNPLTFLWEEIPFSFVLDWVVNVGEYIASYDRPITFPYVLAMVGHTLQVDETITKYTWLHNPAYTPSYLYKGIYAVENNSYFIRQPGIPIAHSGLEVSLPTLSQLSLALALGRSFFS